MSGGRLSEVLHLLHSLRGATPIAANVVSQPAPLFVLAWLLQAQVQSENEQCLLFESVLSCMGMCGRHSGCTACVTLPCPSSRAHFTCSRWVSRANRFIGHEKWHQIGCESVRTHGPCHCHARVSCGCVCMCCCILVGPNRCVHDTTHGIVDGCHAIVIPRPLAAGTVLSYCYRSCLPGCCFGVD
jgi:hypothetical protein